MPRRYAPTRTSPSKPPRTVPDGLPAVLEASIHRAAAASQTGEPRPHRRPGERTPRRHARTRHPRRARRRPGQTGRPGPLSTRRHHRHHRARAGPPDRTLPTLRSGHGGHRRGRLGAPLMAITHPTEEERQALCEWLTANDIDYNNVPLDSMFAVTEEPDGQRLIHYTEFVRDEQTGNILADPR